jgi:hypothetical protein
VQALDGAAFFVYGYERAAAQGFPGVELNVFQKFPKLPGARNVPAKDYQAADPEFPDHGHEVPAELSSVESHEEVGAGR